RNRGRADGPGCKGCTAARTALVAQTVLQVPRGWLARRRPVAHADRCLARRCLRLRRLRRRAVQPVLLARPDLREHRPFLQDLGGGRRVPEGLPDIGRVFLLPDRHAVPPALLRVQLPAGLREPVLPLLYPTEGAVHPAPELRRPALPMPARG